MGEYQADVNGAINIADRYLSGESHAREHTDTDGDDSAEDGGRLTASAPQDTQADATQQETLGTYAS
ncbi:MAG: hypothetical protein J07HQW2_03176 [Haloquadratum walsbyi J07HQW2]|uniref:Uncharacterized protein n=1 Tax=Haloquadratum walsbyi J07HQW2 TaxID=1238425 RepID=U1NIF3_9EURY|nr:MAG: hypothetical protein J07HQW2_03176 [Haloquadratum walsbyi J07HQW2]